MPKRKKIHFVGIGGIGVSALAQYYLAQGWEVSGSDLVSSEITDFLTKKGAKIFIGPHSIKPLKPGVSQVIYSPAIKADNPELKAAKKLKIKCLSYPQALGELTKKYFTIAISGTHGKSTTCAMVALVLIRARLDPTVILGTKLKEFGNCNFRLGKSKYLVIEADEWQASFLNYWPKIIVLTNIEKEHLDYYKNLRHILNVYKEYISHLPKGGVLIVNEDDQNISKLKTQISNLQFKIQNFSLKFPEAKRLRKILKIPGIHNVSNALATLALAKVLKIPKKIVFRTLAQYKGAWRRFEIKIVTIRGNSYILVNDYAHHPTEIKATLQACRDKWPQKRIWTIFQPHQYQRTFYLFDDFIQALGLADKLILTEIYEVAGRETKKISSKISSKNLAQALKKQGKEVYFIKDFQKISQFLKKKIKPDEIILVMGAGNIYKLVDFFNKVEINSSPGNLR